MDLRLLRAFVTVARVRNFGVAAEELDVPPERFEVECAPPGADYLVVNGMRTDVTSLLPTRDALLDRLAERLPAAGERVTTLLILGLLRRAGFGGRPLRVERTRRQSGTHPR